MLRPLFWLEAVVVVLNQGGEDTDDGEDLIVLMKALVVMVRWLC